MICCSCGKEIYINYGREYWNGLYCKKCADEMLSTPEDGNSYVLPNRPLRITQLYSGEEVEKIVKERDEYKHRAEVAEKALRNAAPRLKCRGGLGEGFCGVDKCDYYHCNNDEGCVKAHLQQAEKELAEEGKDEER